MPSLLGVIAVTAAPGASGPTGGGDGGDGVPSSETRPSQPGPEAKCLLRVFNYLRTADSSDAWLTVSDEGGVVRFEGPLTEDGVEVELPRLQACSKACLHLETASWHRQAQVELNGELVEHVFA